MKSAQSPKKRVALKLFLLLIICLAPLIGALFLYQARDNVIFASKSHGTLVIPSVNLESLGISPPSPARWVLAYYTPNNCDETCEQVKAHFSVMELSLAKDRPRLTSLIISPDQIDVKKLTDELLPPDQTTVIWLIDPLGNIILRYDAKSLDNRMLLDLRYLLKVSQIG